MKQIIAMGGGGFAMEPDNPLLDVYALAQTQKDRPNVLFLPTASGDDEGYIKKFYDAFHSHACNPTHLSLFRVPTSDMRSLILEQDIICVGGGNTKSMLALWREWELDVILRDAWEQGIVLAGMSAGAICWFEEGLTDSFGDQLRPLPCLGFLSGAYNPHYDGEPERRPMHHAYLQSGDIGGGYAVEDGVALHFIESELVRVVSSRPTARAYRLERVDGHVIETPLETAYLGT